MKTFSVYMHKSPNNKVYIGITQQKPEKRWKGGNGYKCHHPHFYNAIIKYGWDNIKHVILFDCLTKAEAEQKEIELIKQYKSNDRRYGYNVANGGNAKGKNSKDTCMKISQGKMGIKNPMYGKKGKLNSKSKAVRQYNLNGEFIKEWDCIHDIDRTLGFRYKDISSCCNHRKKSCYDYQWRFASDNIDKLEKYINKKSVNQYEKNGDFIKCWLSISEASSKLKISKCAIINCCKKKPKYNSAGGYIWKYDLSQ